MNCPNCHFENPDHTRYCGNCATLLQTPDPRPMSGTATMPAYVYKLVPGKVFESRYQIIEEIGAGGMGRVYKARDLKVNENVALKLIHPEIAYREKNIERFRNELRLTRKISHRNVCRMFDLHESEGAYFISMEYVPGEDLKNSIRMMGPFTIGKAVAIARQVCEGLKEAHRNGIYHRDLKSKNIILDRDGNAHIMDFGIASSIDTKGLTDNGVAVGTPAYMSPEQASGKNVDQRSDIYSLGVILYEMVTGKTPFKGDSNLSVAMQHKLDAPKPPRELNHHVTEPLNRLILKCLAKKKESRYQNVEEILGELAAIEDELSTGEKRVSTRRIRSTTFVTSIRNHKAPVYALLGAVFLIVLVYVVGKNLKSGTPQIRMAVLPIEYLGSDQGVEHIWRYLATRIGDKLHQRFNNLIISDDRSVANFARQEISNKEFAEKLQLDYLLNGKMSIENGAVIMSLSLIDTKRDISLERMDSNCRIDEIYDQEVDRFVNQVGRRLNLVSAVEERGNLKPDSTAMMHYVQGQNAERMYRDSGDKIFLDSAEQHYLSAYSLHPDYAMYSWLLGNLYELRYEGSDEKSDLEQMADYYRRAYDLDDNSAEANLGMGWVNFYRMKNDAAYEYFRRAFELDPNNFEVNYHVAGFFRSVGLYDKAIKYYDLALALNPGEVADPTLRTLPQGSAYELRISCLIYLGRFQEALISIQEARQKAPDDLSMRFLSTHIYLCLKMYQEAEQDLIQIKSLNNENPRLPFYQAILYASLNEKQKALEILPSDPPPAATYLITQLYCALGSVAEAILNIQRGIDSGFDTIQTYVYPYQYLINNSNFAFLRTEPDFQEIVRTQKRIYDDMVAKYRGL